jgi:succinate dehydrogenase / fumarate reductase cytochrome b subunit
MTAGAEASNEVSAAISSANSPERLGMASGTKGAKGTLYRGREGMWSWVAQRVTGVLVFFFLFAHVLDTALVRVSPNTYDKVIGTYKNPIVNLLEVGLVGAVMFHAFNGLRIIAIDFWSKGPKYQRQLLWAVVGLWAVLMAGFLQPMMQHTLHEWFGW